MKVIDPGHQYKLASLDGDLPVILIFVKRDNVSHPDGNYPGNIGSHPGTNIQEVLRALINRVLYLDKQVPAMENQFVLADLRRSLLNLERRARRRRKDCIPNWDVDRIETYPTCKICGHIECTQHDNDGN